MRNREWSTTRNRCATVALVLAMVMVATGPASGSGYPFWLLYQHDGASIRGWVGYSVAGAGDMNADGKSEFIIGAPLASPGGRAEAGSVYVYSGLDGSLLYQKDGLAANDNLGWSVAGAGDVNGDGRADFVIGAPNADPGGRGGAGSAYVYSGLDGSLLYQKDGLAANDNLGWSVAGAGDVNGDGRADFVIGAPTADPGARANAGSAYVYSGLNGSLLYQEDGPFANDRLGSSVAGAGDVNGDGQADFIIGAPMCDVGGSVDAGLANVYSGASGSFLYQKGGAAAGDLLGYSVAGAGDVNGDGKADFIIGARGADPGGRSDAGSAYVYSGLNGSLLYQKDGGLAGNYLGYTVAGAGDVNADGKADFVIGAPFANPGERMQAGSVYLYSGFDGSLLYQLDGAAENDQLGSAAPGAGDIDGDGKTDLIIGTPLASPGGVWQAGSVSVFHSGYWERIVHVIDVGNDQGRRVRVQWKSLPGNDNFAKDFAIYRRVGLYKSDTRETDPYNLKTTPPGDWDFVVSVPARGDTLYSTEVTTDADSTIADGMYWSVFFVSAIGDNPMDHFDSPPDSGYSKDNLVPAPPTALIAAVVGSNVTLDWRAIDDADFKYYWVYRDTIAEFALSPSKRIGSTSDTAFLDNAVPQASAVHYRVAAVDFSGNEGLPSNEASVSLCACDCHADPLCDGIRSNVQDVVLTVNVAFRGAAAMPDPNNACPYEVTDTNCSGTTDVVDVVKIVNVAFRGANPATEFCDPCP